MRSHAYERKNTVEIALARVRAQEDDAPNALASERGKYETQKNSSYACELKYMYLGALEIEPRKK